MSLQPLGMHSEGLPELLAGIDADVYVPPRLPMAAIARVLRTATAAATDDVAATEALARRVWVEGVRPQCEQPPTPGAVGGDVSKKAVRGLRRQPQQPRASPTERAASASASAPHAAASPHRAAQRLCEVISPSHAPLFVSPHDLASLRTDRRMSAAELGLSLLPLGMGNCCGRQNTAAADKMLAASAASVATLSRGPWCPSSTFWILHRRTLPRQLAGLRLWQQAYDARALTRDAKRLRWEYVGCSMLAPGEAVLQLYYNYSRLEEAHQR